MPEVRRDPLTHDWVIVAAERAARPDELGHRAAPARDVRDYDEHCPLCPGHEEMTPPTVLVHPATGPWQVRVVSNKCPIVAPAGGAREVGASGLLAARPAV